jgi:hypothetical protein
MAGKLNAKVILVKCAKTKKPYGIRIEERGRDWMRTWAFKIDERKAKHEGFDANTVTGSMNADDEYPGCPHCGGKGFVQCSCGKIGCFDDSTDYYTCPWCGNSGKVQSAESFDVSGGGF